MIVPLIVLILVLVYITVVLNIQFYREKREFEAECSAIERLLNENTNKESFQREQLYLSEELDENIKSSKNVLREDISKLNYELFDILAKNNLLK